MNEAELESTTVRMVSEAYPVSLKELPELAAGRFGDMVKAVVDVRRGVMLLDSMINLRPSAGNRSRGIDDPATRDQIITLVGRLIRR
jgi:hypothetical protein